MERLRRLIANLFYLSQLELEIARTDFSRHRRDFLAGGDGDRGGSSHGDRRRESRRGKAAVREGTSPTIMGLIKMTGLIIMIWPVLKYWRTSY